MISMCNLFMGKSMLLVKSKLSSSASICGKMFVTTGKTFDSCHSYNKKATMEVHRVNIEMCTVYIHIYCINIATGTQLLKHLYDSLC